MASRLWTPPKVAQELAESTAEHQAAVLSMFDFNYGSFDKWNRELKKIDPLLRLGKAKDKASAVGVIPGFYHLLRIPESDRERLWTMPLHDGNYGFVEPSNAMLDALRRTDMQNPRVMRDFKKAQEDAEALEEKLKEEAHHRRVDQMYESWKAYSQVRIPFHNDAKWSQNVAGLKGVKR
jgi:hypothetical protein